MQILSTLVLVFCTRFWLAMRELQFETLALAKLNVNHEDGLLKEVRSGRG